MTKPALSRRKPDLHKTRRAPRRDPHGAAPRSSQPAPAPILAERAAPRPAVPGDAPHPAPTASGAAARTEAPPVRRPVRRDPNPRARGVFLERVLVNTVRLSEDPGVLGTLHLRWHQELRPCSEIECDLVEKIVEHLWQARRLREMDGVLLERLEGEADLDGWAEYLWRAPQRQAAIASCERQARSWMKELDVRQARRLGEAPAWPSLLPHAETRYLATPPPGFAGVGAEPDFAPPVAPPIVPARAAPAPAAPQVTQPWGTPLVAPPVAPPVVQPAAQPWGTPPPHAPPPAAAGDLPGGPATEPSPPAEPPAEKSYEDMTDAEFHEVESRKVPLPQGYRYTKARIVHDDPAPPGTRQKLPLKVRLPTPYPGQPPIEGWPAPPPAPGESSAPADSPAPPERATDAAGPLPPSEPGAAPDGLPDRVLNGEGTHPPGGGHGPNGSSGGNGIDGGNGVLVTYGRFRDGGKY